MQPALRDPNAAQLAMAPGTTINAGAGNVFLAMGAGSSAAATSGDITVANVIGNNVSVSHKGPTSGAIVRADAASLLSAATALNLENESPAGTANIGTPAAPMRIQTPALEAHTLVGGIFIDSPNPGALQIGGVPNAVYGGAVRGVQTLGGGNIAITVNGDLTRFNAGQSPCGAGGGSGGPICANDGDIALTAATLGAPIPNRIQLSAGTGNVSATSTAGGIFIRQLQGDALLSRYSFNPAANQPVQFHASGGDIVVDASLTLPGSALTLGEGSGTGAVRFVGPVTVTAGSLMVAQGVGAVTFDSGAAELNVPTTINRQSTSAAEP